MSDSDSRLLSSVCRLLLRVASLLVSRRDRAEWLAEWQGELHHVLQLKLPHRACIAFSCGAFPDALWMRAHSPRPAIRLESPRRCLAALAAVAVLSMALALLLPGTRRQIFPPAWNGPRDLVALSPVPSAVGSDMEVSAEQYLEWSEHAHPNLVRTAFYQPNIAVIHIGARSRTWSVGRATQSLATLLTIPISQRLLTSCAQTGAVPLVLSRGTWIRDFGSDPNILGQELRLSGHRAVVVAISRDIDSALPLPVDAFSLESAGVIRSIAGQRYPWGYMLARLSPGFDGPVSRGFPRVVLTADHGDRAGLYGIALSTIAAYRRHIPDIDFLLSLFLMCLILPVIFSVSLRSGLRTERLSPRMRLRSGLFLGAKILLLLPVLYCLPLLLGQTVFGISPDSGHVVQVFATLVMARFAAFWAVRDQRNRCPHCLGRLDSPARVGESSRSFLSFSGTEYVCAEGHGLLHVPDFPTSWFPTRRWLALDPSWRVLFQHGR